MLTDCEALFIGLLSEVRALAGNAMGSPLFHSNQRLTPLGSVPARFTTDTAASMDTTSHIHTKLHNIHYSQLYPTTIGPQDMKASFEQTLVLTCRSGNNGFVGLT